MSSVPSEGVSPGAAVHQDVPDYDLEERRVVTSTAEVRAMFHPLRGTLLDLLLERAATVGELAAALGRPPSTVAYHVGVLFDAGLLTVVRTRKIRAVEARYYGRTARLFQVGRLEAGQLEDVTNLLAEAAAESAPAHDADRLRAIHRHVRIPHARADEFWERVLALAGEYSVLPRGGDTAYAFVAALYPTDYPTLPDP